VIRLNRIIEILLDEVAGGGQELIDGSGVGRCAVGIHFRRVPTVLQRASEKSAGGRQIPPRGYQHIDDLPILIDCPVQIPPPPGDLYIHLVSKPTVSRDMPARRATSMSSGVNRCTHRYTVT
jgi:hypothetical protein